MGNKLGWILAAALAAVVAILVLVLVLKDPSPEPPTEATTREGVLEMHTVGADRSTITTRPQSGSGNAAADYLEAAKIFEENEGRLIGEYRGAARGDPQIIEDLKALDRTMGSVAPELKPEGVAVLERIHAAASSGASKGQFQFVNAFDETRLTPTNFRRFEPVGKLNDVSTALNLLASYYIVNKQFDKARQAAETAFLLGQHMMDERSLPRVHLAGAGIQTSALQLMQFAHRKGDLQGKPDKAIEEYLDALGRHNSRATGKWRGIFATADPHTGDIIHVIEEDKDRMWRAEALAMLGIMKFLAVGHKGNEIRVQKLMDEYASSDDPLLAAAARGAKEFSKEDGKNKFHIKFGQ